MEHFEGEGAQGRDEWLSGALEAMLFVTDEPVDVITFADALQVGPVEVERALSELRERLERDRRGIQLREVAGGWRLYTHPAYHDLIERYVVSWDTRRLTQASLETLAIVAYLQPVTRAGVASIRGVNSDSSINSLLDKGLLREAGSADAPGNPTTYATTRAFLERFGLRSTADLPPLESFAPDDATRELIRERLSITRGDARLAGAPEAAAGGAEAGGAPEAAAGGEAHVGAAADGGPSEAARDALAEAMAASLGLVDKIDFDELVFDTDDE